MKILIIFWNLFLGHCLAVTITDQDRKLLSDLPNPTSKNLRWLVPADGWEYIPQHLAKGHFFRISLPEGGRDSMRFKFYKNSKLEGKPAVELDNDVFFIDGKKFCEGGRTSYERPSESAKGVLECVHALCQPFRNEDSLNHYMSNKHLDSEYLLNTEKYDNLCPYKINYHTKAMPWHRKDSDSLYDVLEIGLNTERGYNHYFKPEGIAKDKSYIEVLINGEKYYLDLRFCKEKPENCKEENVKFSDYEKDWIELKKHQEKKDIDVLNILISELKPCVEKKDLECIKKFFPDKRKEGYLSESYEGYEIPEITLDNNLLKELTACLDYKNLLPHLYGSKGIEKVCIFERRGDRKLSGKEDRKMARLLNVTYPEAVRVNKGDPIYMKP